MIKTAREIENEKHCDYATKHPTDRLG